MSSHTTILHAEKGRPLVSGHSGDLARRLMELHDLVERVFALVEGDPERTGAVLGTAPRGRQSPLDELRRGDPTRAYLAVLDNLRSRRPRPPAGD